MISNIGTNFADTVDICCEEKCTNYDDQVDIVGDPDPEMPFSLPGDSGSAIASTVGPTLYQIDPKKASRNKYFRIDLN